MEMLLIEFERTWWADDQPKDAAIAEQFSLTTAEYYEQLHALIDSDEALEHDPLVVRRLRRMRDRRRREPKRVLRMAAKRDNPCQRREAALRRAYRRCEYEGRRAIVDR